MTLDKMELVAYEDKITFQLPCNNVPCNGTITSSILTQVVRGYTKFWIEFVIGRAWLHNVHLFAKDVVNVKNINWEQENMDSYLLKM